MPLNKETKLNQTSLYTGSYRPQTMDSMAIVQEIQWVVLRVLGEFSISQFSVVCHFHNFGKRSSATELCFTLPKYCKTFYSPL